MTKQILYKIFNMKNWNYITNGILLVAVIVLFILHFAGKKTNVNRPETPEFVTDSASFHLPVAYIRTDSLLLKYKFSIDLNNALLKKVEDRRLVINQKADQLNKAYNDFQQKAQMNAFISQERQSQVQDQLLRQKQDLDNFASQIDKELSNEQMQVGKQITDTIINALKLFNTPKKYELIFSSAGTDNILYAEDSYDITNEFIEFLNARYVPAK